LSIEDTPSWSVAIALAKVTEAIADEEEIAFTISRGAMSKEHGAWSMEQKKIELPLALASGSSLAIQ
jgi:hypothetical protein